MTIRLDCPRTPGRPASARNANQVPVKKIPLWTCNIPKRARADFGNGGRCFGDAFNDANRVHRGAQHGDRPEAGDGSSRTGHPSASKQSRTSRCRWEFLPENGSPWSLRSRVVLALLQDNKKPANGGQQTRSRRDETLVVPPSRSHQPTAGGYRGTPSPSIVLAYARKCHEGSICIDLSRWRQTPLVTIIVLLVRGRV